tara:strand:- start:10285 stop:10902 length:618 start_codon:yes stop_codon:yes gene_type:complete
MKVKICGLTNSNDINNVVHLGADAIGVIFYEKSPRSVSLEDAEVLFHDVPAFVNRVGVFVNQTVQFVNEVSEKCQLDYVQLHGDESVSYCQKIKRKIIKAFRVSTIDDIKSIVEYKDLASAILLDTKVKGSFGGTGQSFDWGLAIAAKEYDVPVILSGGINISNVQKAIQIVDPYCIDISSGVEIEPGVKDYHKLEEFIRLLKVG